MKEVAQATPRFYFAAMEKKSMEWRGNEARRIVHCCPAIHCLCKNGQLEEEHVLELHALTLAAVLMRSCKCNALMVPEVHGTYVCAARSITLSQLR